MSWQQELTFLDCLGMGEQHRIASTSCAAQFSNPDYIEQYDWDSFDPDYFSSAEFQSLSAEEQFHCFPKCIVENTDNYLGTTAVKKMLAYMDERNVSLDRIHRLVDDQRKAWALAKRFNLRLNTRRSALLNQLDPGKAERIRREKRAREARQRDRRDIHEEARQMIERRRALARQQAESAEAEGQQRAEAAKKKAEREQVQAVIAATRLELADDLKRGAVAMRQMIKEFSVIDEMDMQDVQKQCETLGARIGRFVRLFSRRLKTHVEVSQQGAVDWWVVQAAVEGVISVVELVYYDAVTHMDRNPDVNWTSLEVLGHLIRCGARQNWGDTLFKMLFETGIDQEGMSRWVHNKPELFERLEELVRSMDRCGMDEAVARNFSGPFRSQWDSFEEQRKSNLCFGHSPTILITASDGCVSNPQTSVEKPVLKCIFGLIDGSKIDSSGPSPGLTLFRWPATSLLHTLKPIPHVVI